MAFEHQTFWKSSRSITAIFFEQNLQSLRTCMYEKRILWKFQKFEDLILQGLSKKFEQKIFKFSELYEKRILAKFQKFENLVLQILQNFISLGKLFKENQTLWDTEYIYIYRERERERERCVCWGKCFCILAIKITQCYSYYKDLFWGEKRSKIATLWGKKIWIRHILTKRCSRSQEYNPIPKLFNFFLWPGDKFG
jgi:hypothetical protein